jgi:hypothetical protein
LRRLLIITSLALIVLSPVGIAAASPSQTPRLHFNGRSPALRDALLTAGDIESIPGGPLNVTVSKVNDTSGLYQDPDPRLPCGKKVPVLKTSNAVEEQFAMPEVDGIEVAANVPGSESRVLFSSYAANLRPGCTFRSKTDTGSTQSTTLIKAIPMPKLTTRSLGIVAVITNNGQTFGAYEMAVQNGSRVAVTILIAQQPVHTTFVVALAKVLEERLQGRLAT